MSLASRIVHWSRLCGFEPREREFFALAVKGFDDDECAKRMGIKPSMIAAHRKHIVRKVNATFRGRYRALCHFPDVLNVFYRESLGVTAAVIP